MHGFGEQNHLKNISPCCSWPAVYVHRGKSQEQLVHGSGLALKEAKVTEIWDYSYLKATLQDKI